jgi:predicted dinucleotide-binding enzyme
VRIGVFGTGNVGGTLGRRWAEAGHSVQFGARDPGSEEVQQLIQRCPEGTCVGTVAEAAKGAEVILLAVPWDQTQLVLQSAGDLDGKIILDCINPLLSDLSGLELGMTDSAAEQIAAWAPTARVVKAFNTLSAATMEDPSLR